MSLALAQHPDERISNLLACVPARSVILLEDIDSFFHRRQKADAQVKLSYSGFINALGGVAAIRSGRVDIRMELSNCDGYPLEQMFLKFFTDADAVKRFAASFPSGEFSPATIQERLLKSKSLKQALVAFLPDQSAQ